MNKLEAHALMIFDFEVKQRTFFDWLTSHTSGMRPLHRHEGIIILSKNYFAFQGVDIKTKEHLELIISRGDLAQLYYGFDEIYSAWEVRGLGIFWKPLRLTINRNVDSFFVYFIINFSWGTADNKQWFETLKHWVE